MTSGAQTTGQVEAGINAVIAAPTTSRWLKAALADALHRDCVDAAHDAELRADLWGRRCDSILGRV
ncbi:hypothetical protein [Xanthomonas phaseoli]|uniref:hypothetical protein n=1 Tax=Xanthomonas phaseoli TaxID=1985254 RepID=UPI000C6C1C9A|nr:hypothetical protein [Xanthomonas phaseoli]ATS28853.1 hypothetical protein XppCFBP6546P_02385 [Xanthomonas phaseoli pv. phaseoli]QTK96890.1 hypothetical protein J6335_09175 [Xanthomonas phaseoli pv. phaseoli]